ncbi:hypothetical protein [Mariniphaga sp.]|uniref:hypothetical protein n=1 Tax=Mariniphaga sp. TaxID=1954475 RepID=UPI003565D304
MILLGLPMFIFVLVYFILDFYVKREIPNKELRKKFKQQNEFYLILAYLFAPLLMLQNELVFLNFSAIAFDELNIFLFLLIVKITSFILAGQHIETLFRNLKAYNTW